MSKYVSCGPANYKHFSCFIKESHSRRYICKSDFSSGIEIDIAKLS